jgi:hypothetical protein
MFKGNNILLIIPHLLFTINNSLHFIQSSIFDLFLKKFPKENLSNFWLLLFLLKHNIFHPKPLLLNPVFQPPNLICENHCFYNCDKFLLFYLSNQQILHNYFHCLNKFLPHSKIHQIKIKIILFPIKKNKNKCKISKKKIFLFYKLY